MLWGFCVQTSSAICFVKFSMSNWIKLLNSSVMHSWLVSIHMHTNQLNFCLQRKQIKQPITVCLTIQLGFTEKLTPTKTEKTSKHTNVIIQKCLPNSLTSQSYNSSKWNTLLKMLYKSYQETMHFKKMKQCQQ